MDENALICSTEFEAENELGTNHDVCGGVASPGDRRFGPGCEREELCQGWLVVRLSGELAAQRSKHEADAVSGTGSGRCRNSHPLAARVAENAGEGSTR